MKRKIFELLLMCVIFFPIAFAYSKSSGNSPALEPALFLNEIILSLPQIILLVYVLWLSKQELSDFGIIYPKLSSLGWAALGFFGAFLITITGGSILKMLPQNIQDYLYMKPDIAPIEPQSLILVFFFCVVIGYKEELFFRSYFYTRLTEFRIPKWVAIAGTSLFFGSLHLYQGIFGVIVTGLIGLLFQLIYLRTKNIHGIAIAHVLYNFATFLIAFLAKDYLQEFAFIY